MCTAHIVDGKSVKRSGKRGIIRAGKRGIIRVEKRKNHKGSEKGKS